MRFSLKILSVAIFFSSASLWSKEETPSLHKKIDQDFLLITIPKSGTHLFKKMIYLISQKDDVILPISPMFKEQAKSFSPLLSKEKLLNFTRYYFQKNLFLIAHMNFLQYFENLPEDIDPVFILLVRDLRDVLISAVHYKTDYLDENLGYTASFDEKLMRTITGGFEFPFWKFDDHASKALSWRGRPNTHFFRFEDLCGPKGGGSLQAQRDTIERFCSIFNIQISDAELSFIMENLWGKARRNSMGINNTFRKGQVGSWREVFTPEHIAAFKEHLGEYLIQLGYEKNNDW